MQKVVVTDTDTLGRIGFFTQTVDDVSGAVVSQTRTLLEPGHIDVGTYVRTDTTAQSSEVIAAAAAAWTQAVHDAFAAFLLSRVVPDQPVAQIDLNALNGALAQPGSVVRALALLMLQRINAIDAAINALNTKTALAGNNLPIFTQAQLVSALQALMR